jgi:bifunctional non-homologous end joining protein LigD
MPVTWDELEEAIEADDSKRLYWMAEAALARLESVGDLFAPVLKLKQSLPEPFLREARKADAVLNKPRRGVRVMPPPRASEQGGRRTFTFAADGLVMDIGEERYAFRVEGKVPTRAKLAVRAVRLQDDPPATTGSRDAGTVELIEGNAAKGYLYLFFSGKKLKGEYTLTRDKAGDWFLVKGFAPWRLDESSAAKTKRPSTR